MGYGGVAEDGGRVGRTWAVQDAGGGAARGDEWKRCVQAVAVRRWEIARGVHCGLAADLVGAPGAGG